MTQAPLENQGLTISKIEYVAALPPDLERERETLYITPFDTRKRDLVLGHFMDVWSGLEQTLVLLLIKMLGVDYATGAAVFFNTSGPHQYRDLFNGIAEIRCDMGDARKLGSLMERLKGFATKRNKIVHGQWNPEVAPGRDQQGRPFVVSYTWKRIVTTQLQSERDRTIQDPQARHKLWFLEDDIIEIAKNITILRTDISNFTQTFVPQAPKPFGEQPAKAAEQ